MTHNIYTTIPTKPMLIMTGEIPNFKPQSFFGSFTMWNSPLFFAMVFTMWGPQTIAKLVYNSNNYGLWYS